ncbi:MAG: Rhodanese domain protein [Polaromonas sp.]|nr:Rhodanese domain protein [Polaromonas sp.]
MQILNIAAYKFVALDALPELKAGVAQALAARHIKGSVLLADEGINLFLAAGSAAIHDFLAWLRRDARFEDLDIKESWSATQPFGKLLVRVKPEIIRMNQPALRPSAGRAPAVGADTLKRWLDKGTDDDGRPVVMLDTRNTYEVDAGTFRQAVDWRLEKFTEFAQAVKERHQELAGKTVVSFCTGGIRCEKAALYLQQSGMAHVYQLDGGILKYFEVCGQAHFDGDCFVFDDRRAVDSALRPRLGVGASSDTADAPAMPSWAG